MSDYISRADALAVIQHCKDPVKGIQDLPGVGWIPVTERMPDSDEQVLVEAFGRHGNVELDGAIELASFVRGEGWILEVWPEWEDVKVTRWMPVPEPPKED